MADRIIPLLDQRGHWTVRDRQRHHLIDFEVPEGAVELRIHFQWGPLDLGSEQLANQLSLGLFGPRGFRGSALRADGDQELVIGGSSATPGFLPGPIDSGRWTIAVDSNEILNDGADTGFLTWRLEATARLGSQAQAPSASTIVAGPRPPMGGNRWYRGDLHSHTVHSDGAITVEDRARRAVERGLDFLAITDHNTVSQHREVDRWPDGISPIRGSEVTTFHGHVNCLGLATAIDWRDDARGRGAAAIVEQAHQQDALVSINHPSTFGNPLCSGCHWDFARVEYSTFDAVEVWNGRWAITGTNNEDALAFWTDLLDARLRLAGIAGTDSHSAEEDAYAALPWTYIHAPDPSERALLDGIRRGHVLLSSGPLLSFRATGSDGVDLFLPGQSLPEDGAMSLTVDVEGLAAPATLWFATSGFRVVLALCDPGMPRVVTNRRLAAATWWRLELRDGPAMNGDLLALTNPVYVS